jgi:hypothetical protein
MSNPTLVASGVAELIPMARTGSPASHVSYIIRNICVRLGKFEAGDGEFTQEQITRMELGSSFEDAVASALAERYARSNPDRFARTGELERDGIIGTPDLLDVVDWAVIEVKLTWMSSAHDIESPKFWHYWVQLMAYCYMADSSLGRLHIGHINGDYRGVRGPVYHVWEQHFTHQQLRENWRMLLTNR